MRAFYYMSVKGVRVAILSGLLAFTACGSSGGQVRGETGGGDGGGGGSAQSSNSGGDDDFTRRDVTEVKAPVYLEGIAPEAQDAFREAVAMVSRARPDLKGAEKKFKEASEKAPDFLEAFFNWGQTLERQGKGDEALKVYQRALDQNPGDPTATAYIAKVYLGKSRAARFLGKTQEADDYTAKAKQLLEPLVQKDPTNVQVNNAMALYHLMKDDMDAAERFVKEVLYVEPSNVTGLNTRGLINLKRGKLLMAKWIFEEKVLRLDPGSTEAHTNLGYTYIKLELRPLAMRHFQEALENDAENMEVRMNIAAMLLEHLDYANALGHYEKVLEAQPNNMEARIGRCDAMFGLGGSAEDKNKQFTSALDCYDAYVKENPERADLLKRIADTYQIKLQNLEKAVEYYELYGKKAKLTPEEAEKNKGVITVLKDIIAKGGLKALENPPTEENPEAPAPEAPAPDAP